MKKQIKYFITVTFTPGSNFQEEVMDKWLDGGLVASVMNESRRLGHRDNRLSYTIKKEEIK